MPNDSSPTSSSGAPAWVKPVTEFGPLAAFFIVYFSQGILPATAVLVGTTLLALAVAWFIARQIPFVPLATATVVGFFGGLTLWSGDDSWIKMKPTIVQVFFAAVLIGGQLSGRSLLRLVLGAAWHLDEAGWRKLTLRFGVFFAVMAGLNEVVWRTQSTDFWVTFKVFGIMALTAVFAASQVFLLRDHSPPEPDTADEQ